jgi:hypothetical protein
LTTSVPVADGLTMKSFFGCVIICVAALLGSGCGRSADSNASGAAETQAAGAKPVHSTYALEWVSNDIPATMPASKPASVKVSVKNTGDWPWNDPFTSNPSQPNGTYAVRLSYRWIGPNGQPLPQDSSRGELTAPVPPGGTANFTMAVMAPKDPGSYQLQMDLVEELVTFFSSKGTQKLTVPVTVQ